MITFKGRGVKVTAQTYFEVQVDLAGTFQPGYAEQGPTYSSGGQPAEPDGMEDVEIVGLLGTQKVMAPIETRGSSFWNTKLVDLLEGVDDAAREIIKANVLKFLGAEADQALMGEVEFEEA